MSQRHLVAALSLVLAAAGCSGGPIPPSENVTTSFSGTVQPLGFSDAAHFMVSNLGEYTVTLTSLTPGNVFVGIGWGQWSGSTCGLIAGQTNVVSNTNIGRGVLSGQIFIRGEYCVAVFDPINFGAPPLTVAQNYGGQVRHP